MENTIRQWYIDATELLDYCLRLRNLANPNALGLVKVETNALVDEKQKLEVQAVILNELNASREVLIDKIAALRNSLETQLSQHLEYSYAELPHFELDDLPLEFWPAFQETVNNMRHWARDVSLFIPFDRDASTPEAVEDFKDLLSNCPLSDYRCDRLKDRIRLENSRLLRDLKTSSISQVSDSVREWAADIARDRDLAHAGISTRDKRRRSIYTRVSQRKRDNPKKHAEAEEFLKSSRRPSV